MADLRPYRIGDVARQDAYDMIGQGAGLLDIGRRRYGPPGKVTSRESDYEDAIRAAQAVDRMVNAERFRDAVSRMPVSENIVYEAPPATLNERFRAIF